MIRKQIMIDEAENDIIKALSRSQGISESEVVRKLIELGLKNYETYRIEQLRQKRTLTQSMLNFINNIEKE